LGAVIAQAVNLQVNATGCGDRQRSNPMVATTANFPVRLLSQLVTGERIFVRQLGCGASATPAAAVRVLAPPALPVPTVAGSYVLTTATSVLVNNVVPGAQVTLFVNNHARNAPGRQHRSGDWSAERDAAADSSESAGGMAAIGGGRCPHCGTDALRLEQLPTDKGGVKAQTPLRAPSPGAPRGGLGSNNNYFIFTPLPGGGCANLLKVSVTLTVQQAIVWSQLGLQPRQGRRSPLRGSVFS
jgi:hypothetical protein